MVFARTICILLNIHIIVYVVICSYTQPWIKFALKRATHVKACDTLRFEYNSMYEIGRSINSPLVVNIMSAFHETTVDGHHCMFLQEQIVFAKTLHRYAQQISQIKSTPEKNNLFQRLMGCYNDIVEFNDELHYIGYIHGDIGWTNVLVGDKCAIKLTVETHNIHSSISNSSANRTGIYMPKTYKYEIDVENINKTHCYLIDFGSSRSKQQLLNTQTNHTKVMPIEQLMIRQTFIFSHPYLYKVIAYHQGRMLLSQHLANYTNVNITQSDVENIIWDAVISCENYATAATFLSVMPQTRIMGFDIDEYGSYIYDTIGRYNTHMEEVPQFEDNNRRSLVLSQNLAKRWHLHTIKNIFQCVEKNTVITEKNKSTLKSMLNSMNESLSWYPLTDHFTI